eukprot:6085317-Amphidinium_carterae.1
MHSPPCDACRAAQDAWRRLPHQQHAFPPASLAHHSKLSFAVLEIAYAAPSRDLPAPPIYRSNG